MEQVFEKLGAFYLGKVQELNAEAPSEYLLYDTKDLTTHALCVGMTGSGKTGLCMSLLEEAGIDGIPAIVLDPKGDLGNLLLTFPNLLPADFRPWIDETEAARQGQSPDQFATEVAEKWREGLNAWGQDGKRIDRFRSAADLAIYTPGSSAGLPLTVLQSFSAPPPAILADKDAFRDRVAASTAGLLALLGLDIDPIQSREFILLSSLLSHAWQQQQDQDIAGLIGAIQDPPFQKIGVMDLDTFYPAKDRMKLALNLNSLLASPSFASWLEGEPLNIERLLYTAEGKPRISILSIAHLSESERMFFVTILLNELLTWVRSQTGTPSLRAIFYMDEVFGYFPPTANPPSKQPMLTLLKQARAYGLGLVLATQNPVDLDYKGLSNCGTWFLGRLQTERDKDRVLDGLESASTQSSGHFNRQKMDKILSNLDGRVFVMNNVHEEAPVIFHTRWAMSYLRGPLTGSQIKKLTANRRQETQDQPSVTADASHPIFSKETLSTKTLGQEIPSNIPTGVPQLFLTACKKKPETSRLVYRPALLGHGRLHFVRVGYQVDYWEERFLLCQTHDGVTDSPWNQSLNVTERQLAAQSGPESDGQFAPLADALTIQKSYKNWERQLKDHFYQNHKLEIWKCKALKEYSKPEESESAFRIRLSHLAHERRDLQVEKIRKRYGAKMTSLKNQIRRAEEKVQREQTQYNQRKLDTVVSVGSSLLGALFGRKLFSRTNVSKASSSAKTLNRTARERDDVKRAKESLNSLNSRIRELESQVAQDIAKIEKTYQPNQLELEPLSVKSRKSDNAIEPITLVWTPWFVDATGVAVPGYRKE